MNQNPLLLNQSEVKILTIACEVLHILYTNIISLTLSSGGSPIHTHTHPFSNHTEGHTKHTSSLRPPRCFPLSKTCQWLAPHFLQVSAQISLSVRLPWQSNMKQKPLPQNTLYPLTVLCFVTARIIIWLLFLLASKFVMQLKLSSLKTRPWPNFLPLYPNHQTCARHSKYLFNKWGSGN